ncbi:MAG: hypothetical protein QJR03_04795 [Sphaerobacter sp.]|nr:hypothetical protein [Sphaerobacter sp.]
MDEQLAQGQRDAAERFAALVDGWSGAPLDFSPASLATLDALLQQWRDLAEVYAGAGGPALASLAGPAAAYVGEVLIRAFGGGWVDLDAPDALLDGRVRAAVLPAVQAVLSGSGRLADYYQAVAAQVAGAGKDAAS